MVVSISGHRYLYYCALTVFALIVCAPFRVSASPANPNPIVDRQPDGTLISLSLKGDEWFHWYEDVNGYTVVEEDGTYFYATLGASGDLTPSSLLVGKSSPSAGGLVPGTLPSKARIIEKIITLQESSGAPKDLPQPIVPDGTIKNIVILVRFSNHLGRTLPTNGNMDTLFNSVGGDPTHAPSGSVADVYYENSYGAFTLDSTVYGWVNVPKSESYYADGQSGLSSKVRELIRDGLNGADALIDFSQFDSDNDGFVDAITFVHSGYAAEFGGTDSDGTPSTSRIWSHRWSIPTWTSAEGVKVSAYHINPGLWSTSGSAIGRVGVICHETGHFFGLPDLYDTSTGGGSGIGSWGMMANSWGFDSSQLHPPHFSSWSKTDLGWVTPTVISSPGVYSLGQAETNAEYYRIDDGYPANEYLLIENRQPAGIESAIPQGGLVVFHIDDNAPHNNRGYPGQAGWPQNGNHYRVAVLQADGEYDLELNSGRGDSGDVYHAGGISILDSSTLPNTDAYQGGTIIETGNEIADVSVAGSTMSFRVSFGGLRHVSGGPIAAEGAPGGPFFPSTENITLTNSANTSSSWSVTTGASWLAASASGGSIAPGANSVVTLSISAAANLLVAGTYDTTATFVDSANSIEIVVDASLHIENVIYPSFLDTDPEWTAEGEWAFGVPGGLGGALNGNADPTSGATGSNVYGVNLSGDYATTLGGPWYLTAGPFDFSGIQEVSLRFKRWLNHDFQPYGKAMVEVSNDGTNWTVAWENDFANEIADSSWTIQSVDVSSVADNESAVYVRWGYAIGDEFVFEYSGWNIDDIEFRGTASGPPPESLSEVWVDFSHTGSALGTSPNPLVSVADAIAALVNNGTGTIKIKGDTGNNESTETFSGVNTISKGMTIDAVGGSIRIGVP